jgi:MYXO-CTERM domain-containing protein
LLTRVEHNAEGGGGPGTGGADDLPRTAPPDPTNRANTAPIAYNIALPPAANVTWQPGHPNIEQAINQCGPASIANSLQWLENTHAGLEFPDPHVAGQNDNDSMVGKIDQSAMRPNDKYTASAKKFMQGKLDYIDDTDQEGKLKIKHKERTGIDWLGAAETSPDGNAKSTEDTTRRSLMQWILDELKDGEDVEIRIGWDNGGGHFVDLIGGGTIFGVPWIAWAHDASQGKAGGAGLLDGGYVWTPVVGDTNRIVNFVGGKAFYGTVDFAASESYVPEPSGALLALLGAAAIAQRRRRHGLVA